MNLNSLITGPARLGLSLAGRILSVVRGGSAEAEVDDGALRRDVEAEVFGSRRIARSRVDLSVTDGVVWLRGEVKSRSAVEEAEARAAGVPGVKRVENLLRVAKAPAKPRAQKRPAPKRSARPAPPAATAQPPSAEPVKPATPPPAEQQERTVTTRFNAERPPAEAEPSPRELAESREGRRPAQLGAEEPSGA
jgi:hypothetical protein